MNSDHRNEQVTPTEIPIGEISEDALYALVESFVLQEGTDYAHSEYSTDEKIQQVLKQLRNGEAKILFDPVTESCGILTTRELPAR